MKCRRLSIISALFVVLLAFPACNSQSDRDRIVGLWQVLEIDFMDKDISDGKEWFEFSEDGKAKSRSAAATYQNGWWSISPEKHIFYIRENFVDSLAYDYSFHQDTFKIAALIRGNRVKIKMVPTDKKMISYEDEMGEPKPEGF